MVKAVQQKLNIQVDDIAGSQIWSAIYLYTMKTESLEVQIDKVDKRNETVINTLCLEVQPYAREH